MAMAPDAPMALKPPPPDETTALLGPSGGGDGGPAPIVRRRRWWVPLALPGLAVLGCGASLWLLLAPVRHYRHLRRYRHRHRSHRAGPVVSASNATAPPHELAVAFVGNSMIYFNDLPRLLQALAVGSHGRLRQDSCLHGDGTLASLLLTGSGMAAKFDTPAAVRWGRHSHGTARVPDLGACTVPQLLLGRDDRLAAQMRLVVRRRDAALAGNDPALDPTLDHNGTYLLDDGTNPCLQGNASYFDGLLERVLAETTAEDPPRRHDFVVLNDNTRNPGRPATREAGLRALREAYLPWFRATAATPVFLDTHAYAAPSRNLSALGLDDVPTFTARTYAGYRAYARELAALLPPHQAPRIAPVGLAFLTVWEEDRAAWAQLFHPVDQLHASPAGSLLTALVLHHALWGALPPRHAVARRRPAALWARARLLQPAGDPPNPFPTRAMAAYLYDVADRVAVRGHRPAALAGVAVASDDEEEDDGVGNFY